MNKDTRGLTQLERQFLIISNEQLIEETYERTQVHFHPDPRHEEEIDHMAFLVKCTKCDKIPLKLMQCMCCEAVYCPPCKFEMK